MRFIWMAVFACCAAASAAAESEPPMTPPTGWRTTFFDKFYRLDLAKWNTTFEGGRRALNPRELETYVDPIYSGDTSHPLGLNPFSVDKGILTIRADRPTATTASHLPGDYTSGVLTTAHRFEQQYGYFEIRAKLPKGKGLWPAFWLVPLGIWPPEIDVFEGIGDQPNKIFGSVHWAGPNGPQYKTFEPDVPDVTASFHTYGALWTAEYVGFYFDRQRYGYVPTPSDMHRPMYMILNLAVGGSWGGQPDESTPLPADLQVDYIQVFQQP